MKKKIFLSALILTLLLVFEELMFNLIEPSFKLEGLLIGSLSLYLYVFLDKKINKGKFGTPFILVVMFAAFAVFSSTSLYFSHINPDSSLQSFIVFYVLIFLVMILLLVISGIMRITEEKRQEEIEEKRKEWWENTQEERENALFLYLVLLIPEERFHKTYEDFLYDSVIRPAVDMLRKFGYVGHKEFADKKHLVFLTKGGFEKGLEIFGKDPRPFFLEIKSKEGVEKYSKFLFKLK